MNTTRMVMKNTLRHPLRNILTVLGIAIAVSAFGLLLLWLARRRRGMIGHSSRP